MILVIPKRPANDNEAPQGWFCKDCQTELFVLRVDMDVTTIRCSQCSVDVTEYVAPTLAIGIDLCRP